MDTVDQCNSSRAFQPQNVTETDTYPPWCRPTNGTPGPDTEAAPLQRLHMRMGTCRPAKAKEIPYKALCELSSLSCAY